MSPLTRAAFGLAVVCCASVTAAGQPGSVIWQQKIAEGVGGFEGPVGAQDEFGHSVATIGDLDDNGVEDLAVGAPGRNLTGAVWVLLLEPDGRVKTQRLVRPGLSGFVGPLAPGDRFGSAVSGIGDVNGDGVPDLAVGAPNADGLGVDRGEVWILMLAPDGGVADELRIGEGAGGFPDALADGTHFGDALAGLGDLDGDDNVDIAVGSPREDTSNGPDAGVVRILLLDTTGQVVQSVEIANAFDGLDSTPGADHRLGSVLYGLGDIDGDGIPDLAAKQFTRVRLLYLSTDGSVADDVPLGPLGKTGSGFGSAVTLVADIDGDGLPTLVVGSADDDDAAPDLGAVWLAHLTSDGSQFCQQKITSLAVSGLLQPGDHFGSALAAIDVNGEGRHEIAAGLATQQCVWNVFLDPGDLGLEVNWTCLQGGSFRDDFCWDICPSPMLNDTIVFNLHNSYTVTNLAPESVHQMCVRDGHVTLELDEPLSMLSATYNVPSLQVGATEGLATLDVAQGTVEAVFVVIGDGITDSGVLGISGGGVQLMADEVMTIGRDGFGQLLVDDHGAVLCGDGIVAGGGDAAGLVNVSGGALWCCADTLSIAQGGVGLMTVDTGGAVSSRDSTIGEQFGSFGDVSLAGPTSTWTIDGSLDVGVNGTAMLEIVDGASLTVENFATVGTFGTSLAKNDVYIPGVGHFSIDGSGSSASVAGELIVGFFGDGSLELSGGGTITVGGAITTQFHAEASGLIVVQIDGSAYVGEPAITVGGDQAASIQIELNPAYEPMLGDTFDIVQREQIGSFNFILPELTSGLRLAIVGNTRLQVRVVGPGDLDGDGAIDVDDLVAMILWWGECDACPADLDGSGQVDVDDLIGLLLLWT